MSDEEGSSVRGWVIFLLIFVAGNLILWFVTGSLLIPLPWR